MAQGYCPKAHPIFNKLVSIDVPDMTTFPFDDEWRSVFRILVISFGIGVAAAGNEPVSFFL